MFRLHPRILRNAWRVNAVARTWSQARPAATAAAAGKQARSGSKAKEKYWNENKLATTSKYPLSLDVADALHPDREVKTRRKKTRNEGKVVTPGGVHVRTQLVSPHLCDDVLKYVGHTLDKHKGCDILDINPGAGLWSRKLHKYLQPRSHVLLEQRHDKFREFLDPLLTAPDSKYTLVDGDPTVLQTYRDLVANGYFPHQTVLDADDPRAQEPNNTLLVTGFFVWDPRLPGLGFDSMAKQLAYRFASAAWTNDLFYAFGLVRTLFWVGTDDFSGIMADSISGLQKTTRFIEMAQNTSVFVTSERGPRSKGRGSSARDPRYDIETTIKALMNGRARGIELPPHRRDKIHDFATDIEQISNGTGRVSHDEMQDYLHKQQLAGKSPVGLLSSGLIEHYEQLRSVAQKYPELDLEIPPKIPGKKQARSSVPNDHPFAAGIKALRLTMSANRLTHKNKAQASAVADVGEEMYELECEILGMQDGPEKDSAMAKLAELNTKWNQDLESLNSNYARAPAAEVDDRLAIRSSSSFHLQWDARPFEPLVMRSDEVWPQNHLSLISAEPNPKPVAESSDFYEWVTDFIFGLFSHPQEGVNHALDKMQHGLSDIINECPSLKDPKKGGRLQMEHLRVRMLTDEMIFELVRAYRNWPFKAPDSDSTTYFKNKHSEFASIG
ncbi:hypothetical protein ACET3X_000450 [Alternaria dauci]|uniref:rRNA adenine N(6)-methyltransferase n=1 Tax=Alternaria dauci TaxID=48095 RepID=A0ABR3UUJ6_9PLEO